MNPIIARHRENIYQKFNSTVAWDVTNGSTPFLTPLEKKYNPAIEKNKLTIVSLKSADIESITEKMKDRLEQC